MTPNRSIVLLLAALVMLPACRSDILLEFDGLRIGGDYEYPADRVMDDTFGFYLTDELLTFIEDHGLGIVADLLGQDESSSHLTLDLTGFINDFLESNPVNAFGFSLRDLTASATFPDGPAGSLELAVLNDPVRLRVRISRLWVAFDGTVFDDDGAITSACHIAADADLGGDAKQSIELVGTTIDLHLGVGPDGTLDVTTDIIDLGIGQLGISIVTDEDEPYYYCNLHECQDGCFECRLFCTGADLVLDVSDFFVGLLGGLVDQIAEIVVNAVLGTFETIEGQLHPALLLGGLLDSMFDSEWVGFLVAPAQGGFSAHVIPEVDPSTANDLALALRGGADAPVHPCMGKDETEPLWVSPVPYQLQPGETRSHLVASISDTFINQVAWAAYKGGGLCIFAGSSLLSTFVEGLDINAGLIALLMPGLDRFAHPDAPLLFSVLPRIDPDDIPIVSFGNIDAGESLLTMVIDEVDLGIYVWLWGRYVRLIEVKTDLSIGLTPTILPDNSLQLAFDSLDAVVIEEVYNELFEGVDLAELVNFVLSIASDFLVEQGFEFDLSLNDLIGQIVELPVGFTIDRLATGGPADRWIELGVTLEEADGSTEIQRAVDTRAEVGEVTREHLELHVTAPGFRADQLEYQVRWDVGPWRGFRPASETAVSSPYLLVPGPATLRVRARAIGDYRSLDMTPAEVAFDVPEWGQP